MTSGPLVSICIPTYNSAAFLKEAIDSARRQTYDNLEIVVSDNASTDGTQEMVAAIPDPRIRYYRNRANLGMVANFRRVLAESRGKYVCLLNSDDLMDPGFIQWAVQAMEARPRATFAFASIRFFGQKQGERVWPLPEVMSGQKYIRESLRRAHLLAFWCGALARADLVHQVGIEDCYFCDWTLWLRLACRGEVLYNRQVLAANRSHDANVTKLEVGKIYRGFEENFQAIDAYVRKEPAGNASLAQSCINKIFIRYLQNLALNCNIAWADYWDEFRKFIHAPASRLNKLIFLPLAIIGHALYCAIPWNKNLLQFIKLFITKNRDIKLINNPLD
jgi:glycosyltransferase involved in cell wall biosynthesis